MHKLGLGLLRPHGLSTKIRVLAFCPDDQIQEHRSKVAVRELQIGHATLKEMLEAGADVAGPTWSQGFLQIFPLKQ